MRVKLVDSPDPVQVKLVVEGPCFWALKYENGQFLLNSNKPDVKSFVAGTPAEKDRDADQWTLLLFNPDSSPAHVKAVVEWWQGESRLGRWTPDESVDGALVLAPDSSSPTMGGSVFFQLGG